MFGALIGHAVRSLDQIAVCAQPLLQIPRAIRPSWHAAASGARLPILTKPAQKLSNAPGSQRDHSSGTTVVEIERITVGRNGAATRENDVAHIPFAFIHGFRPKDPGITPKQAGRRISPIKEGQAETIDSP